MGFGEWAGPLNPGTELKIGECHQPWAQNTKLILSGINIFGAVKMLKLSR